MKVVAEAGEEQNERREYNQSQQLRLLPIHIIE
jgi:hypothetical protein